MAGTLLHAFSLVAPLEDALFFASLFSPSFTPRLLLVASAAAVKAGRALSYRRCGAAYITANEVGVATPPGSFASRLALRPLRPARTR